ncbi:MAG TPA: glycosyltransferase [Nitrososphaeraceae archaeon]|nr:glycosyltransferase [Nitrososphaeraceae archaeon]
MVSTEYPPMKGGVGRYTSNLVKALQNSGMEVHVVCNEAGKGDFSGLSPTNKQNSEVLLKIVNEINPDIVHIQFEPGMYGLLLDPKNPIKSGSTYVDYFYTKCNIPIVTTFHSAYTLRQWMSQILPLKKTGRLGTFGAPLRFASRLVRYLLNYRPFKNLNKEKLLKSNNSVVFSHYMSKILGGGTIIYHGAEPYISDIPEKKEARSIFSLPYDDRLALALGFRTITKGWDIIGKMNIPDGWKVVVNYSKSHFNIDNYETTLVNKNRRRTINNNIIDLQRDFLDERDFSILLCASDVVLLPYRVTSNSGVMFDALAHGLPFIASDLDFFREFASQGLGITVKRNPDEFSKGLKRLERNYLYYTQNIDKFNKKLKWDFVANQHKLMYSSIVNGKCNNIPR